MPGHSGIEMDQDILHTLFFIFSDNRMRLLYIYDITRQPRLISQEPFLSWLIRDQNPISIFGFVEPHLRGRGGGVAFTLLIGF